MRVIMTIFLSTVLHDEVPSKEKYLPKHDMFLYGILFIEMTQDRIFVFSSFEFKI